MSRNGGQVAVRFVRARCFRACPVLAVPVVRLRSGSVGMSGFGRVWRSTSLAVWSRDEVVRVDRVSLGSAVRFSRGVECLGKDGLGPV